MTTSEDLKAEFEKWWLGGVHNGKSCVSMEDIFAKGAELGEAIGYQRGRGYERKRILQLARDSMCQDIYKIVRLGKRL